MHPLFANPARLALYFAGWIPVAALLAYLLAAGHSLGVGAAVLLAALVCLWLACLCLPAWYICRVLPLNASDAAAGIATQVGAAVIVGGLGALAARGLAALLPAAGWAGTPPSNGLQLIFGIGVMSYLVIAAGFYLAISTAASRAAEARLLQTAMLAREAELRALKAQINPHFLFNSLNSISALTSTSPARAREMCILLGEFLRRTLRVGERPAVPLSEELSLAHAFLAIERIRFGDRLRLEEEIAPAAHAAMIPPLLLQPLVENAVIHGVASTVSNGCIRLRASCTQQRLELSLENDFDPDLETQRSGGGMGLANVRGRLAGRYGPEAMLAVERRPGRFRVDLSLPLETTP